MKGGGDWGCSVAHEEGQLLDFEVKHVGLNVLEVGDYGSVAARW